MMAAIVALSVFRQLIFTLVLSFAVLNAFAGEKSTSIFVQQFVVDNFTAYPHQQITQQNLDDLFAVWQKKLGPKLTLAQIHSISDEVTRFYRAKGFMLARALVLPQEINQGVVHLRIEHGSLGEIIVSGQKHTRPDIIARPFQPLLHQVVHKQQVESALQQLEALPGMDAFSYFSAGEKPGETRINLKVLKEEKNPTQANLRFDNFGNHSTGEYRLLGDVQVGNIFGYGERYQLGMAQTLATDSSTVGYLYTSLPFFNPFWRTSLYASNSQFQLGEEFKILEISGRGHEAHMGWQYDNFLSRQPKLAITLGDYANHISSDVVGNAVNRDNQVQDIQLSLQKSWLLASQQYSFSNTLIGGHQSGQVEDADYTAVDIKLFAQTRLSAPSTAGSWALDSNLRFLLSNQLLPSNAQLVIAGPQVNRGFSSGSAAVDQGFIWQTQLYSPTIFSAAVLPLQPLVFIDISGGKRMGVADQDDTQLTLASAGVGLQSASSTAWSFNLFGGYGLKNTSRSAGISTDHLDHDPQIYGVLNYFWK